LFIITESPEEIEFGHYFFLERPLPGQRIKVAAPAPDTHHNSLALQATTSPSVTCESDITNGTAM
jgi:hypothetical protein